MKNLFSTLKTFLALIAFIQMGYGQLGTLEAENGVIVGINNGTVDGTIRYTGSDFEGRKGGIWESLTGNGSSPLWNQNGSMAYYDSGNVGIGVDAPAVDFHINGSNEVLRLSGSSPWMSLREEGQTYYAYSWIHNETYKLGITGARDITFTTNSSERLRIADDGKIGIGTTNPQAKLHVKSDNEALRIDGSSTSIAFYNGATHNGFLYHDGLNMNLSNEISGNLYFSTNSAARMLIDNTGNVGIGTLSPGAKLDVRGSAIFNESGSDVDFRIESDTKNNMFFVDGSTNRIGVGTSAPSATLDVRGSAVFNEDGLDEDFRVESDTNEDMIFVDASENRVGIGTDTPMHTLDIYGSIGFANAPSISGFANSAIQIDGNLFPKYSTIYDLGSPQHKWVNIWATNGTIQTSDRNLKKDIEELPYGLKEIMKLNPVRFKWKTGQDDGYKLGLIAQELLPVLKEVVKTHDYQESETDRNVVNKVELENLGVYYSDIIPVLIKGMQEQQSEIQSLKKELEEVMLILNTKK